MNINKIPEQVNQVVSLAETLLHDKILGIYLYGSATMNVLRPNSDIDILIIINQELSESNRLELTKQLLSISGRVGNREKRPLEVTVISQPDISSQQFPTKCHYMYGEWLRNEIEEGKYPQPFNDPDILILLWQAGRNSIILKGTDIKEFLPEIPFDEIKKAIRLSSLNVLASLKGDERNVLLTLSRMWFTLSTKEITTKDVAAEWAVAKLPEKLTTLLVKAKEAYLGHLTDEWETTEKETRELAQYLLIQIKKLTALQQ